MALEDNYKNAIIIDAVILGTILVSATVLSLLCKKYYRPGRCMFLGKNTRHDDNELIEPQGTSEANGSEGTNSGANNNAFQSTEGVVEHQAGERDTKNEKTTRTLAEMAEGKQPETKVVLNDQVVVEINE